MDNRDLQVIQDRIGYEFHNTDLLQQAFIRKSYAQENGGEHNEILEFIGDKVLDIVIVKFLAEKYGYYCHDCDNFDQKNDFDEFCCERTEGQLTELKKALVRKETLSEVIENLQLNQYLIVGRGDEKKEVFNEKSVKEDLFEAIIGAVALDSNWNWSEIRGTIEYMLEPERRLDERCDDNYVELIQKWSLRKCNELPYIHSEHYNRGEIIYLNQKVVRERKFLTSCGGRAETCFRSELRLQTVNVRFINYGASKSEARMNVCELAYHYLEENHLLFSIRDEIDAPDKEKAINQLEILARRGYFSIPTYDFEKTYDRNGNPIWECTCRIEEYDEIYSAVASSKKEAKKLAALKMLCCVIEEDD